MKNVKGFFENLVRKMGAQVNEMQIEDVVEENNQVEDDVQEVEKVMEELSKIQYEEMTKETTIAKLSSR